jgi:GDP-L-fucose synthase
MDLHDKIYVAGHRGLVGGALVRRLQAEGADNLVLRTHQQLDLTEPAAVEDFFASERPDYVFLAAAKVGGIHANDTYPAGFIRDNLAIQTNVIHAAWKHRVRRLLFLGSSCIYPRDCPQPIREEYLLTGPLEPTNRAYAIAKIAGIEMCRAYNAQYGTRFLAAMPTNLYGPDDNFSLENGHVIPALLRRFLEATQRGDTEVVVWGTGQPRREFLHSDDLASALALLMRLSDADFDRLLAAGQPPAEPLINIGSGDEITIADLARMIADATGFDGTIRFDPDKPDGTPRKLLDSRSILATGWKPRIGLAEGLADAAREYELHAGE